MRGHNPERGPEDRSREGEDDGLRLVDPGHCGGRGPKTPEGRDLPRTRMDLKAHRRVDEEADHHGDDEREQRERRLDLCDAAADKADRAERLKSRQPQCSDDRRVQRCVCQNRLHRPAPRCVHGDQEIRPDVDPIVREERGARRRWGDDREVGEVQPEQTQVPRTRHGPPARGLDLIPQSNIDGDIARTDREPDGSDPRVIRLISKPAAWARIATKSPLTSGSAAGSIALASSSFPWMYTAGPVPIRFATDPTPFARPSARLIAPTRTMHANAIAHAVARVRRVKRVASRKIGRGIRLAEGTEPA